MSLPENFDLNSVDFNAVYQGGPILEGIDLPAIPWDIGAAQPVVIEAEQAGDDRKQRGRRADPYPKRRDARVERARGKAWRPARPGLLRP